MSLSFRVNLENNLLVRVGTMKHYIFNLLTFDQFIRGADEEAGVSELCC